MARKLTAELVLEIHKFRKGLHDAAAATRSFSGKAGKSSGLGIAMGISQGILAAGKLITGALVVTMTAAAVVAAHQAAKILSAAIASSAKMETAQMRFKVLTGSGKIGSDLLLELRKDALRTGVELQAMTDNVAKFMAFGFSSERALRLNRGILDIGGSVGLTTRDMKLLGVALSQVAAKGVANMEELRQQIAEKGIPIFAALESTLGVDGANLNKMIQEGKVSADEVLRLFEDVVDAKGFFGKFSGGAEKMARTFLGRVGVARAHWNEFLIELGAPIKDSLKPFLDEFTARMKDLIRMAPEIGERLGRVGDMMVGGMRALEGANFSQIAELLRDAFFAAISKVGNFLTAVLAGALSAAWGALAQLVGDSGLWEVLGSMLKSIFLDIASIFARAIIGAMNPFSKKGLSADELDEMSRGEKGAAAKAFDAMKKGGRISPEVLMEDFKQGFQGAMKTFDENMSPLLSSFLEEAIIEGQIATRQRRRARNAAGSGEEKRAEEAPGGPRVRDNVPLPVNGALSRALNIIAGRSANAVIAAESMKSNQRLAAIHDTLRKMEAKIGKEKRERREPIGSPVAARFTN